MAYTTINKSTDNFNTKLYTGNGGTNAITGVGFQPDWTWIKKRASGDGDHGLYDAVRGVLKRLQSNEASTEATTADSLTAFGTDGFTMGSNSSYNGSGNTYVSWNFKANGQGSSNTDGTINTTYTSVNTTAGFSIVKYTGNGSNGATVGHGLGVAPEMIIIKEASGSGRNWRVYHSATGNATVSYLNTTSAQVSDSTAFNSTSPTSSVFSLGTSGGTNDNGNTYIAYCFASKTGYSHCGKFIGNGNANGTFVYTGFKPRFIFFKQYTSVVSWYIYDSERDGINQGDGASGGNRSLRPDTNSAEEQASGYPIDILSNGWKFRTASDEVNKSGNSFFYYAIGQALVGSNGVTAKAR
jgi:hypothetical protein